MKIPAFSKTMYLFLRTLALYKSHHTNDARVFFLLSKNLINKRTKSSLTFIHKNRTIQQKIILQTNYNYDIRDKKSMLKS